MTRPAIEARGLAQRFGGQAALHPLDLEVAAGERLAVLGDNGAGKTTLLRLLATAARPAAGELRLFGFDAVRQRQAVRPRLGYLAHQAGLYPALTALENLEFHCALHRLPRSRAAEVLEQVALAGAERKLTAELSRGMQQRLALGRSVLHDPELLVLDEPDASLDQAGLTLLRSLAEGRTLVLATHDRALAADLCERQLRLREGQALGPAHLEVLSR